MVASTVTLPQAAELAAAAYQRNDWPEAERLCRLILGVQSDYFDALYLLGIVAAQTQRMQEAAVLMSRAVALAPDHADACNNLGVVLRALQQHAAAFTHSEHAIVLAPAYAEPYNNRGNALCDLGRYTAAAASFEQALALAPDFATAYSNRGNALRERGRSAAALASYERAIALAPGNAEAHSNCGAVLADLKRHEAACACCERAIALAPDLADAYNNLGNALREFRRQQTALASCERALTLNPHHAAAHSNRGHALRDLRRPSDAFASYQRALALAPADAQAYNDHGNALRDLRRPAEALASYQRALALAPAAAGAYVNRGNALLELEHYASALDSYEHALATDPGSAEAHCNRGVLLAQLRRYDAALESYARAIAIVPDYASAHHNLALCCLQRGDWARGWKEYEWRWVEEQLEHKQRGFSQPLWLGSPSLADKTLLVHCEQGLGDTLQFCRYVPLLADRGARVVLEVQPPLLPLLGSLEGAAQVLARGAPLPVFDYHCPLLSLPLAFNTQLNDIPLGIPYVQSNAARVSAWQRTLGAQAKPRVGLVWSGSLIHRNDRNRSITLAQLLPVLSADIEWVSLQQQLRQADAQVLAAHPDIRNYGDQLKNFADTAALVELMDLVVTVDTAVAHLAGAMGKPVWILLPHNSDWRWLLDCVDSGWYPTARLFRQPAMGDWASVIQQVGAELAQRF